MLTEFFLYLGCNIIDKLTESEIAYITVGYIDLETLFDFEVQIFDINGIQTPIPEDFFFFNRFGIVPFHSHITQKLYQFFLNFRAALVPHHFFAKLSS